MIGELRIVMEEKHDYEDVLAVFCSKMKTDEILYLLWGLKLVVRQGFYESEKQKVVDFCVSNELFCEWSDFKVIVEDSKEGFSNKGSRVPLDSKGDGMQFCYISKDERLVLFAKLFEKQGKRGRLGEILGYPFCCQAYFCVSFSEKSVNPVVEGLNGLMSLDFRDDDICLLSHFPCSNDCYDSTEIAKRRLRFLEKNYVKRAEEMKKILLV